MAANSTGIALAGDCKGLNDQQTLFVAEYMKDFNSKRAAKAAGYASDQAGQRLLANRKVKKAIAAQRMRNLERHAITKDEIISILALIAKKDLADLCDKNGNIQSDPRNIPKHARLWLEGVVVKQKLSRSGKIVGQEIELKTAPRLEAINMLMKHLGMYAPEKSEITHSMDWDSMYAGTKDGLDDIEAQIVEAEQVEDRSDDQP